MVPDAVFLRSVMRGSRCTCATTSTDDPLTWKVNPEAVPRASVPRPDPALVPMPDQPRSRLLRSELEREFGGLTSAERFLVGLDESWSPWDGMYRSSVYRMLGEIAEADERPGDAIRNYTRLLQLWRDADPDLIPLREEIEARRNALVRATG